MDGYAIRVATRAEIDLMADWAAAEGWNPGLRDVECFHAADAGGFLVGLVNEVPVACISAVRYGADFGFVGFYIVRPDMRGRGLGWAIWQAAMERLDGRVVGLDGVVAQQANYARSGFVLAHRNVRYGGTPTLAAPADADVVPVEGDLVDAVIAYDGAFFAAPRQAFARCWLRPEKRRALALVRGGTVRGYGVIRDCRAGRKVGPLFAEDAEGADLLFRALVAGGSGEVFVDPPATNPAAVDLAARHGLAPVFETARMYKGAAPDLPHARTFGITTFELG